jgi:O-antigen ligase
MTVQALAITRTKTGFWWVVTVGLVIGLIVMTLLKFVGALWLILVLGGVLVLLPAFIVNDPRAYGLFLAIVTIPIDLAVHTTTWWVSRFTLFEQFGLPASGTLALDLYMNDIVFIVMLLPWLVQVCLKRRDLYVPKIAYVYIIYLAYTIIVAMIEAKSFYLSLFEWMRECLYLLFFIYIVNNVVSRCQFRAVVLALVVGLSIESAVTTTFFVFNIVPEESLTKTLLYGDHRLRDMGQMSAGEVDLPVAESGPLAHLRRSKGTFNHPSHTAYYLGYITPIVLALLAAARRRRERLLLVLVFTSGCLALLTTFARAGVIGMVVSIIVFLGLAAWSKLISYRAFALFVGVSALLAALSMPLALTYIDIRPTTYTYRFKLLEESLGTYMKYPIFGAGLNNSSAVAADALTYNYASNTSRRVLHVVHNHYIILAVEVGAIGFLLFFGFFGGVVAIALKRLRDASIETKPIMIGIITALAGTAVHNLADPFGSHMCLNTLWLYAAMLIATSRQVGLQPREQVLSPLGSQRPLFAQPAARR